MDWYIQLLNPMRCSDSVLYLDFVPERALTTVDGLAEEDFRA